MADALDINSVLPSRVAAIRSALPTGIALAPAPTVRGPVLTSPVDLSALPVAAMPRVSHSQTIDDVNQLNTLQSQGPGIDRIQNPVLRGLARGADLTARVAGSLFAPLNTIEHLLPGTSGNHDLQVARQRRVVADDQAQDYKAAQIDDERTQQVQHQALAEQEQARAYALTHPQAKPAKEPQPVSLQQAYADRVTDVLHNGGDPSKDAQTQQLADAITGLQRQPAAKEPNKDDRYIAIQAKPKAQWSPEEQAYVKGYDQYVEKNKIQPAGVRASVMLQMPQAVVDPNDPSRVIYTDRRHAMGMEAPGSGDAAAARGTLKDFATGTDAHALNSFNTAQYHLQTLKNAADALKNGNVQLFNQLSQSYAQATGSAAPTNFDAVKLALRGEVAKALAGHATVSEQSDLDKNFSRASSPAQLAGIASTYHELLEGKKQALRSQYEAGKQGRPDFDGAAGAKTPKAGDVVDGYRFKGGNPNDQKNWVAK